MLRTIAYVLGFTALIVPGLSAHPALAVDVPFDFYAGNKVLPAGQYEFHRLGSLGKTFQITNRRGVSYGLYLSMQGQQLSGARSSLVFHRYGDSYFLKWVHGPSVGLALGKSQTEKERRITGVRLRRVIVTAGVLRPIPARGR